MQTTRSGGSAAGLALPDRASTTEPVPEIAENLHLMRLIDEQYLRHPELKWVSLLDGSNRLVQPLCACLGTCKHVSMDGRGRALDNVFIERLRWTVKFEEIYPKCYADGHALLQGLDRYFHFYNHERKHSSLDKRTPADLFMDRA